MLNFKAFIESFNTVADLMLNPANANKSWNDLFEEFKKSGGRIIGAGKYGEVLDHPSWPYVLKTFYNDPNYLKFARFAYKHPFSAFPKLYGPPQKIVPFYTRDQKYPIIYIARIERLKPFNNPELYNLIDHLKEPAINYFHHLKTNSPSYGKQEVEEAFNNHPQLKPLMEGFYIIRMQNFQAAEDMHADNIMQRNNGELVLIDPLWEGSSPYADAARTFAMETDNFPDYDENPPTVVGGKMPVKKRVKKKKYKPVNNDDIPF